MNIGPSCLCCPDAIRGICGCCGFYCCCGTPVTEAELKKREEEKEAAAASNGKKKKKTLWQQYRLHCFDFMKGILDTQGPLRSFDVDKIYWDVEGNLRQGGSVRDRDEELLKMLEADQIADDDPETIWAIIPSRFIREWLLFAKMKISNEPPNAINIASLLKADLSTESGWRPLKTLRPPERVVTKDSGDYAKVEYDVTPGHYRRISLDAWRRFVTLYGIVEPGVVIAVKGNTEESPYSDMTRWRIFPDAMQYIDPNALPDAIVVTKEEKAKIVSRKQKLFASLGGGM